MLGALGRNVPPDFQHVEKYPLSGLVESERPVNVPVAIAVNWYTAFDSPRQLADGSWHLPSASEDLGTVRGGHCTCLEPIRAVKNNSTAFWRFYNQGQEGACEGFGHARVLSILRGKTFDAFWLYDEARKLEGAYPQGEGTTSRSVCQILLQQGLRVETGVEATREQRLVPPVEPGLGISAYRWATTAEEVCNALGRPNALAVPLQNSWGEGYPEVVWLPVDTLDRLLREEGEADVITPR